MMNVHLVFVTKYRGKVFDQDAICQLRSLFSKICHGFEAELVAMEGETEHVQLLVNYPPKVSVSVLVNSLKGASSRMLHKRRPDMADRYYQGKLWSPSYFAASGGEPAVESIHHYLEQLKAPL